MKSIPRRCINSHAQNLTFHWIWISWITLSGSFIILNTHLELTVFIVKVFDTIDHVWWVSCALNSSSMACAHFFAIYCFLVRIRYNVLSHILIDTSYLAGFLISAQFLRVQGVSCVSFCCNLVLASRSFTASCWLALRDHFDFFLSVVVSFCTWPWKYDAVLGFFQNYCFFPTRSENVTFLDTVTWFVTESYSL